MGSARSRDLADRRFPAPLAADCRSRRRRTATPAPIATGAHYVGSAACESCHKEIYARWKQTRMANVVRDPHEHPDAVIPDFSKPDPD